MRHVSALLVAAAMILPIGSVSAATLIGETVMQDYYLPDVTTVYPGAVATPPSFVVGDGVDGSVTIEDVTTFNADFAASSLQVLFDTTLPGSSTLVPQPFSGLIYTSEGFRNIVGFTVGSGTNLAGFDASRVSIVGNELRLNLAGLTYNTDTVVDLTFAAVPEPASWALMVTGFGMIGSAIRRRRGRLVFKTA